ncbi:MAG TPA: ABC transporter permease [Candidatus Anoxymicrobiaceae bacterium]|jgi:putative ABC transport system permease protein
MTFIFRNMWRRKGRTFLTIFGIIVGIFALTVLGGMTARMNQQINGMKGFITDKITVAPADTNTHMGLRGGNSKFLELSKVGDIQKVPGVKGASGMIMVQLKAAEGMSQPQMMVGYQPVPGTSMFSNVKLASGRELHAGDAGKVVLGSTLATDLSAKVGQSVTLLGQQFEVAGIMDTTLGVTDTWAFVPYQDSLNIFLAQNPFIKAEGLTQQIAVFPKKGVDIEALSAKIQTAVPGIKTTSPKQAEKMISSISTIFSAIILGIAFIALFVGGLSVINTMIMSVSERRREIGVKKAIGATTGTILVEYLGEAAVIGLVAGAVGMLLGLLAISGLNRATSHNNVIIFTVTATVVAGPVIFATILATLAGLFPALRAARLNPVDALKEE